jgi:small acid-soluble spore protein N (minor)
MILEGVSFMAKSNHAFDKFRPNHYGTQPRKSGSNKGKQYANKTNEQPDVIQTKGE